MPYVALSILSLFVFMPLGIVLKGWALSTLWSWFIVTTFGLPSLGIAPAIGVCMVASYLTKQVMPNDPEKSKEDRLYASISHSLCKPPLFVFIGWIVNHWMPT
jgi:Na+/H+ antiporter NhaA